MRYPEEPPRTVVGLHYVWQVEPECDKCYGAGNYPEVVPGTEDDYIPDFNERYCDCEAGRWRRVYDGDRTAVE